MSTKFEILTKNPSQTKKIGKILAAALLNKKGEPRPLGGREEILRIPTKRKKALRRGSGQALIFGLIGDLGGGKTTFLQGFAKGLGIRKKILSPTFVILKKFKIQNSKFKAFYHIDCYRIKDPKEILNLGFRGIISNPQNIIAIEWAGKIRKILPKNSVIIGFNFINKTTRKIIFRHI